MINEFRYGQTRKIWPSPLSFPLYSTFKITQGNIDTLQENDIHAILHWLVLRRGVYEFEKNVGVNLF